MSTYYLQHNTLLETLTINPLSSSILLRIDNPLKKPIWLLLCFAVIYSMCCRLFYPSAFPHGERKQSQWCCKMIKDDLRGDRKQKWSGYILMHCLCFDVLCC